MVQEPIVVLRQRSSMMESESEGSGGSGVMVEYGHPGRRHDEDEEGRSGSSEAVLVAVAPACSRTVPESWVGTRGAWWVHPWYQG